MNYSLASMSGLISFLQQPKSLTMIWVLAITLRLGYAIAFSPPPTADFAEYDRLAIGLAEGKGYIWEHGEPTAFRAIGYPAFLGGVYWLTGNSQKAGQIANTLLGLLALWLAYQLAQQILKDETSARLALLLLAFHPNGIMYGGLLASEPLSLVLMLAGFTAFSCAFSCPDLKARARKGAGKSDQAIRFVFLLSAGIAFGLAALVKPQMLIIPGFLFFMPKAWQPGGKRPFWAIAGIYVVMALVILPWTYRNYKQLGEPVLISSNGGYNLFVGNSQFANGRYIWSEEMEDFVESRIPLHSIPVPEWSKKLGEYALEDMRQEPVETLARLPLKLLYLYAADIDGARLSLFAYEKPGAGMRFFFYSLMVLSQLWYLLVYLPLAWVIFKKRWKKLPPSWGILLVPALSMSFVSLVFFGASRFHYPFLPFLVILSAGIIGYFAKKA
jgi:hypothetical protein